MAEVQFSQFGPPPGAQQQPGQDEGGVQPPSWKKSLLAAIPIAGPALYAHAQQEYASKLLKQQQQIEGNKQVLAQIAYYATGPGAKDIPEDKRVEAEQLLHDAAIHASEKFGSPLPPDLKKRSDEFFSKTNSHIAQQNMQRNAENVPSALAMPPTPGTQQVTQPAQVGIPGMIPQGTTPGGKVNVPPGGPSPESLVPGMTGVNFGQLTPPPGMPPAPTPDAQQPPADVPTNMFAARRAELAQIEQEQANRQLAIMMHRLDVTQPNWRSLPPEAISDLFSKEGQIRNLPATGKDQVLRSVSGQILSQGPISQEFQPADTTRRLPLVPSDVALNANFPPPGAGPQPGDTTPRPLPPEQRVANDAWEAKHPGQKITPDKYAEAMQEYKIGVEDPQARADRIAAAEDRRNNAASLLETRAAAAENRLASLDLRQQNAVHASREQQAARLDKIARPVEDSLKNFGALNDALSAGNPQAEVMIAPLLIKAEAGGVGSGLRITNAEINAVKGGRTVWESIRSKVKAFQLNPDKPIQYNPAEREQIRQLMKLSTDKLAAKNTMIQDARSDLLISDKPADHMKVFNETAKKISDVDMKGLSDNGLTPPAGGAKVATTADIQAYMDAHKVTRADAVAAAKKSGYTVKE